MFTSKSFSGMLGPADVLRMVDNLAVQSTINLVIRSPVHIVLDKVIHKVMQKVIIKVPASFSLGIFSKQRFTVCSILNVTQISALYAQTR